LRQVLSAMRSQGQPPRTSSSRTVVASIASFLPLTGREPTPEMLGSRALMVERPPPLSSPPAPEDAAPADLTPVVGENLRRLRTQRGLSLEKLSKASGVSRAMLGQVELGQSAPTINVLWKIARALGVPFSTLITQRGAGTTRVMPLSGAKRLTSADGRF